MDTVLVFVLGCAFMFILGYITGHWRCRVKYASILNVLQNFVQSKGE